MLGKYDSRSPLEVSLIRHHSTLSMNGTQQPVWVSRTTLIFGNLILSAAIVVDGWLPVEFLVHRDVAEAVDIWPPKIGDERRSVSWPPAELITASTLPRPSGTRSQGFAGDVRGWGERLFATVH